MTEKEREKLGIGECLGRWTDPPVSDKQAAKLLAKEMKKSLAKKGYEIDSDDIFAEKRELHDGFAWDILYDGTLAGPGYFPFSCGGIKCSLVAINWLSNDKSILKTAKANNEFKAFVKDVKKDLKSRGKYHEPEAKEAEM